MKNLLIMLGIAGGVFGLLYWYNWYSSQPKKTPADPPQTKTTVDRGQGITLDQAQINKNTAGANTTVNVGTGTIKML